MRIPGFETRTRISTEVPTQRSMPGSRVGEVLQNLGGQAAQFGQQLMQRKKQALDSSDTSNRTLDHQRDFLDFDSELRKNLNTDGRIRPQFMTGQDGEPLTYADAVEKFWDESIPQYSEGSASPEAREAYLNRIRSFRDKSILKADQESSQMLLDHTSNTLNSQAEGLVRVIGMHPHVDAGMIGELSREFNGAVGDSLEAGNLSPAMAEELNRQYAQRASLAFTNRLIEEGRMDEARGFLYAGAFDRQAESQLEDLETKLNQNQIEQHIEGLGNRVTDREKRNMRDYFTRQIEDQLETRMMYADDDTLASLSNSLTPAQVSQLMGKISNVRGANIGAEARRLRQENRELQDQIERGTVDVTRDEDAQAIKQFLDNYADTWERASGDASEDMAIEAFNTMVKIASQGMGKEVARLPIQKQTDHIDTLTTESVAEMVEGVLGISTSGSILGEQIKRGGFITRGGVDRAKSAIQNISDQYNQLLAEDPAVWADSLFGEYIQGSPSPGGARIEVINAAYTRSKMGTPHFYTSQEERSAFKERLNSSLNVSEKSQVILEERQKWGNHWMDVSGEYLRQSGVSSELKPAFLFHDPAKIERYLSVVGSEQARETLERINREDPVLIERVQASVSKDDRLEDFYMAMQRQSSSIGGADGIANNFNDAVTNYAALLMQRQGLKRGEAIDQAVEHLVLESGQVITQGNSTLFLPQGVGPMNTAHASRVSQWLQDHSEPEQIMNMLDRLPEEFGPSLKAMFPDISDEEINQRFMEQVEAGRFFWATSPDMRGVVLRYSDNNGLYRNAPGENGNPIIFEWNQIHSTERAAEELRGRIFDVR